MNKKLKLVFVLILFSTFGFIHNQCSSQQNWTPTDMEEKAEVEEKVFSKENLQKGKSLYSTNCGKCHPLYPPEKHTKVEWARWVKWMKFRADLSEDEASQVLYYLESEAKQP